MKRVSLEESIGYRNKIQNRPSSVPKSNEQSKSFASSFSMTGMHQRWYRCEAKSHTLARCTHVSVCTVHTRWKSAADTRDYVYTASRVVPIASRRRDAARSTLEKGRDWMEFEAKPPIPASIFKFSVLHSPFVRYTNSTTIPFSPLTFLQRNPLNRESKENRTMVEPGLYEREVDTRSLLSELRL